METKTCSFCAEEVRPEAKACPHCGRWLTAKHGFLWRRLFARRPSLAPEIQPRRCPCCGEPVKPQARACPHCRHLLGWAPEWLLRHPSFLIGLHLIPPLAIAGMILFMSAKLHRSFSPGTGEPSELRGAFTIQSTKMRFSSDDETIHVTGSIRNESRAAWTFVAIKVDFFDAQNELSDTARGVIRKSLQPGQTAPFEVQRPHWLAPSGYARYEARVVLAHKAF